MMPTPTSIPAWVNATARAEAPQPMQGPGTTVGTLPSMAATPPIVLPDDQPAER